MSVPRPRHSSSVERDAYHDVGLRESPNTPSREFSDVVGTVMSLPDVLHGARLERDRRRMVEAASWMIREDHTVDLASVAAVAGVSRLTAYRSFSSLDDLVDRVRGAMSARRAG